MSGLHPRLAALMAALEADPGLRIGDLAERAALPPRQVAMLLWRLEEERFVVHEADRWFTGPAWPA